MDSLEMSFTQMVRKHKSTIYTVCMMFGEETDDVEDLVQETLINLWRGFSKFEGRSQEKTWIWRVAMNTCISQERKQKARKGRESSLDALGITGQADEQSLEEDRQMRMLYDRIHQLEIFDRAIVLLWLENLPYEEIGDIVGISAKNVSVRLVRIREKLKRLRSQE